ncbi:MAG TPA: monovalent cation/H+ antiporter subunit A, partial [Burkholderiales bacterium]|nr:monovalent cation/H+ antiporter subunit A [Burkholderiales bacterium]
IGLLIILYARYYLAEADPLGRFYAFLLLFMGSMLGIVLADNLLLLVVFWELTSVSSFLLIGYWNREPEARQGARMALSVTGAGGLALLGGFLLLGHICETYEISQILTMGDAVRVHPLYVPTLALILAGAFTKSAQFPFHFWLPKAMAAPTPVSAYLHSATMVKTGVFLLARFFPVLSGTDAWFYLVGTAGAFTFVLGAYFAVFQHDLKGLLAYSTISHLGLITLLLGFGTPLAAVAAVFHIINHATFKASLFMAAGIIDHETGSRDMRRLNGLWKYMPYTATLAMVAAASMAGVPLLNGFLSKEMFFGEALELEHRGAFGGLAPIPAVLGGVFSVAYSARFIHDVFFHGQPVNLPRVPHEPPRWMKFPVEVLVALCLLVGMLPAYTVAPLLEVAARSVLAEAMPEFNLAIWHGFNLPLLMSAVALGAGTIVYFLLQYLYTLHAHVHRRYNAQWVYDAGIGLLRATACAITDALENGSLQRYLAVLIGAALIAGALPFLGSGFDLSRAPLLTVNATALTAWAALVLAALAAAFFHRNRIAAVICASVVGTVVVLAFAYLSAPDLALTQLCVELVTIVLLLLALYLLPAYTPAESSLPRKIRDAALALGSGAGMGALAYALLTQPVDTISGFFLAHSVPGGGGSNVVNVILVDFRGFDTLGEIVVLAIAALGVYALIHDLRLPRPAADSLGRRWSDDLHPLILVIIARGLLPLALLVSAYLFLRGHNQPGGGFVAGLMTAIALILQYMASGIAWARDRLAQDYRPAVAAGLALALGTGLGSWIFGHPFLTSAHGYLRLPIVGDVHWATAIAFDLGVYVTVVGATLSMLAAIGEVYENAGQTNEEGEQVGAKASAKMNPFPSKGGGIGLG